MLAKDIERKFVKNFQSLYPMLSFLKELRSSRQKADFLIEVGIPGKKTANRFACEIIAEGFPKYLRLAAGQLKTVQQNDKSLYPVIVAPYISDEGRKICREEGIGFFDLSGNCLLAFNGTYIEVKGNPNRFPTERKLTSIFKGKSSRIPRVLLLQPDRRWTMRELSKEASLSLGLVFKVITRLEDLDVIVRQDTGVQLTKPADLLDRWRKEYSYRLNDIVSVYSLNDKIQNEKSIADECRRLDMLYALTLFSGASRVAPFTRYNQTFAFVDDPLLLAETLSWKPVDSGANILLLKPYDEGVYYGSQQKDRITIASSIQLYLDLYNYKGRGEEQAEFLRSQIIKF